MPQSQEAGAGGLSERTGSKRRAWHVVSRAAATGQQCSRQRVHHLHHQLQKPYRKPYIQTNRVELRRSRSSLLRVSFQ